MRACGLEHLTHAERVHQFERPALPPEPPPHHAVDIVGCVGDSARDPGCIDHGGRQRAPQELADAVVAGEELTDARLEIRHRFGGRQRAERGLLQGPVLQCLRVDDEDVRRAVRLFHALVEALAGLLACEAGVEHPLHERRERERASRLAVGEPLVQVGHDVPEDVDAGQIQGAEGGAAGAADRRTRDGVHFLD